MEAPPWPWFPEKSRPWGVARGAASPHGYRTCRRPATPYSRQAHWLAQAGPIPPLGGECPGEFFLISLVFGQFLVENFAANIGPEFSQFIGYRIPHHEHSQCPHVSRESAIFRRVVEIGDAGRRRVAEEFGVVEPRMTRVRASHEKSAKGIPSAGRGASAPLLVVARIFTKKAWENG